MKIAFVWFTFARDEDLVLESLTSVQLTMERADADVALHVVVDANDPISEAAAERLREAGAELSFSDWPRGGNNKGRECVIGMMGAYSRILGESVADYVCKIDSDTLLAGTRFLERLEEAHEIVGVHGAWRGFTGMWGMYFLGRSFVESARQRGFEDLLQLANQRLKLMGNKRVLGPDFPEDQSILQMGIALMGRSAVWLEKPNWQSGLLNSWKFERKLGLDVMMRNFDFVTFGHWAKVTAPRALEEMRKGIKLLEGGTPSMVFGLGSGRSGTSSLAEMLGRQPDVVATHERFTKLPWVHDRDHYLGAAMRLGNVEWGGLLVDVAWYWLAYVERLAADFPEAKFIVMQRDVDEVAASFDKPKRFPIGGEVTGETYDFKSGFPNYAGLGLTRLEALRRYAVEYNEEVERLYGVLGEERMVVLDVEDLNDVRRMDEVMRWAGVDRPVAIAVRENAS